MCSRIGNICQTGYICMAIDFPFCLVKKKKTNPLLLLPLFITKYLLYIHWRKIFTSYFLSFTSTFIGKCFTMNDTNTLNRFSPIIGHKMAKIIIIFFFAHLKIHIICIILVHHHVFHNWFSSLKQTLTIMRERERKRMRKIFAHQKGEIKF